MAFKINPLTGKEEYELDPNATYPESLARWNQPAPEPAAVPPVEGLRPPVALNLPGSGPVPQLVPGATIPDVLKPPPPPSNDNSAPAPAPPAPLPGGPGSGSSSALADAVQVAPGGPIAPMPNIGPDVKVTQMVRTPGEVTASGRAETAADVSKDIARRAGDNNVAQAKELESQLQAEQKQLADQQKAADARRQQETQKLDAADNYLKQQREAYAKDGIKSFYSDKTTARGVFSALMVGLGQYAATLTGGPNIAWGILKDSLDRHDARERDRLAKSKDMVELAGKDQATAERRKEYAELELRNQKIALLEDFKRQRETRMAKYGATTEELKSDALINQIESERAKEELLLQQGLRKQVTTDNSTQNQAKLRMGLAQAAAKVGPDKSIKDADAAERKHDAFMMRATNEVKNLQGIKPYSAQDQKHMERWRQRVGTTAPTSAEKFYDAVASIDGDVYKDLSPEGKKRFLSEKNYARSILRPESGAVIGGNEYADTMMGVQRFASDTPEIAQQKAQRMRVDLEGLAVQSYRPGYWNSQMNPAPERPKMTSKQRAEAVQFVKDNPNHEDTPAIRQLLMGN